MDYNNSIEIGDLIYRSLKNELNELEQLRLQKWLNEGIQNQQLYEKVKEDSYIKEKLPFFYTLDVERALEKVKDNHEVTTKVVPMKSKRYWLAAASVIILFIAGYTFLNLNKTSKFPAKSLANTNVQPNILPGGSRATLTLADGRTIVLDSVQNGKVSTQGNIQIIKLEDGKLAYEGNVKESNTIQYNTISTPRGGEYKIALSDGSLVWLNAASSITFPTSFSGDKREVKITGEAYFEVAHNAKMPFHVLVSTSLAGLPNTDIKVIGTHFNVNAYADEGSIKTTLLEGSVQVSVANQSVKIMPGQQAVESETGKINVDSHVDIESVIAWQKGKFYFNESSIQAIMKQVSRWYNVDVEYNGAVNKVFEGSVSRNVSAQDFFKILSATGGVHFSIEGKKVIVSP